MNRRECLHLITGSLLALGAGLLARFSWERETQQGPKAVLTPEMEEGPFYIDLHRLRRDITEDRPGIPLRLCLTLVDLPQNAPLPDAAVDIWHCDASGEYSGYRDARNRLHPPPGYPGGHQPPGAPSSGANFAEHLAVPHCAPTDATRFLRGLQVTDANGVVEFRTIYPGWYGGRDIHIHLKVHVAGNDTSDDYQGGHVCHVGQLFFPDEINDRVAQTGPYSARLSLRTLKAQDPVYLAEHGEQTVMKVSPEQIDGRDGYLAEITLGINPATQPAPVPRVSRKIS